MTSASKDLVITRTFNAPREKVWQAWTTEEGMKKWWGPKNFTCPTANIDFRVGGKYHVCMHSTADNKDFWSGGEYKEIIPNEKLVCTDHFSDAEGNIVSAAVYGMDKDWPEVLLVTVLFQDAGPGKTKLTLTHSGMPESQMKDMTGAGWNELLDKLADSLA